MTMGVKRGRGAPRPQVPTTDREGIIQILKALADQRSDERASENLAFALDSAEAHAHAVLSDRTNPHEWKRERAKMLLDRVEDIRLGMGDKFSGWSTERYLLSAIDLGVYIHELDGFYASQPGRPELYNRAHFERYQQHRAKGLKRQAAALATLREMYLRMSEAELKSLARGLYEAAERHHGKK